MIEWGGIRTIVPFMANKGSMVIVIGIDCPINQAMTKFLEAISIKKGVDKDSFFSVLDGSFEDELEIEKFIAATRDIFDGTHVLTYVLLKIYINDALGKSEEATITELKKACDGSYHLFTQKEYVIS